MGEQLPQRASLVSPAGPAEGASFLKPDGHVSSVQVGPENNNGHLHWYLACLGGDFGGCNPVGESAIRSRVLHYCVRWGRGYCADVHCCYSGEGTMLSLHTHTPQLVSPCDSPPDHFATILRRQHGSPTLLLMPDTRLRGPWRYPGHCGHDTPNTRPDLPTAGPFLRVRQILPYTQKWTCWDLNPGPSACEADVIPLHHKPDVRHFRNDFGHGTHAVRSHSEHFSPRRHARSEPG